MKSGLVLVIFGLVNCQKGDKPSFPLKVKLTRFHTITQKRVTIMNIDALCNTEPNSEPSKVKLLLIHVLSFFRVSKADAGGPFR